MNKHTNKILVATYYNSAPSSGRCDEAWGSSGRPSPSPQPCTGLHFCTGPGPSPHTCPKCQGCLCCGALTQKAGTNESQCIILWAGEPRLAMSQSKGEKSHSQNVGLHVQLCHLGSTDYIRNDTVDRYQIRCPGRGPRPSRGLPLSDAPSAPSGHEPFSPFFPATWKSLLFQSHLL